MGAWLTLDAKILNGNVLVLKDLTLDLSISAEQTMGSPDTLSLK